MITVSSLFVFAYIKITSSTPPINLKNGSGISSISVIAIILGKSFSDKTEFKKYKICHSGAVPPKSILKPL
jgi:hypothetical protein